jgi:hypothetical protein
LSSVTGSLKPFHRYFTWWSKSLELGSYSQARKKCFNSTRKRQFSYIISIEVTIILNTCLLRRDSEFMAKAGEGDIWGILEELKENIMHKLWKCSNSDYFSDYFLPSCKFTSRKRWGKILHFFFWVSAPSNLKMFSFSLSQFGLQ